MRVVIYNFNVSEAAGKSMRERLSNGETLLERHFRMLKTLGVREIEVVGDKALSDYAAELVGKRRDLSGMSVLSYQDKLNLSSEDEVLLIDSGILYTQNVLNDMYASTEKCQVLAEFRQREGYDGLAVRLDMDYIVEIKEKLVGLDCCPIYPMMHVNFANFEEITAEELQSTLRYESNREFLASFVGCVSEKIKGILQFAECGDMKVVEDEQDYALNNAFAQADLEQRAILKGCGSIVFIKDVLEQEEAAKVLVVHDKAYEAMPFEQLFMLQGVEHKTFLMTDIQTQRDKLKKHITDENIDFVIAVGDGELIKAADAARKELFPEQLLYPEVKLMAVPDMLSFDYQILPDYLVLDGNLVYFRKDEIDKTFLGNIAYRAVSVLLNQKASAEAVLCAQNALKLIGAGRGAFYKEKPFSYQRLLEACHYLSNEACVPNAMMGEWIDKAATLVGCDVDELKCMIMPQLAVCINQNAGAYSNEKATEVEREDESESLEAQETEDESESVESDTRTMVLVASAAGVSVSETGQKQELKKAIKILIENNLGNFELDKKTQKSKPQLVGNYTVEDMPHFLTEEDLNAVLPETFALYRSVRKELAQAEESGENLVYKVEKKLSLKQKIVKSVKKNKLVRDVYTLIFKKGRFKLYQLIYPVNKKWVLFEAYGGTDNGYSCNTRAIYEAMLQDPDYFDYKFIWAFIHPSKFKFLKKNPNTITVKRGSKRYLKFCARAGYIFTNTGMPKYIKPNRHQKMVYTWHGKPLKRIGCSFKGESEGKRNKKQLVKDYTGSGKRLSILLSPAPIFTDIMADAYNLSPKKRETAMLETGYPRNDYLFKYTEEDVLRIKMNLQIPLDKKVVLYAPTWRPFKWVGGKKFEHTPVLDLDRLKEQLGDEYVFLCRLHHLERDSMQFDQHPGFLYDVSMVKDVNELYIISDLLISDYSGTVFDFANLKRPIVLFMYDQDEYVGDANGLNFDLDFLPGPIVETQDEMVEAVKYEMEHFVYEGKYQKFNEACNGLDGADCAIRTAKQIVEINPEATKKQQIMIKLNIIRRNTKLTLAGFMHKFPFLRDENTRRIASYRNKYKGERCFLIGNGPSLRLSDLNMLKDEYCFGCNMIYKVFERSDWRPTFLCASDRVVAQAASEQLQDHPESTLWVSRTAYDLMEFKGDNLIYVNNLRKEKYYVHGNMVEYYVPSIATVMTFMIELAMYMGFSEIYLLGVDFTIGRNQNDHFMNSYRDKNMTELEHKKMRNMFRGENLGVHEAQIRFEGRALYAYEKLAEYADKNGYKVYNATRGGMLEVFERANLDEVVKNK